MTRPRTTVFREVTPQEIVLGALQRLSAALDEAQARLEAPAAKKALPPPPEPQAEPLRRVHPVRPPE